MVIILVRKCVRPGREEAFVADWRAQRPDHPDFLGETLTRIDDLSHLPEPMRSLPLAAPAGITYLNVARWRRAESFVEHFRPRTAHNPELELADELRIVLTIVEESSS